MLNFNLILTYLDDEEDQLLLEDIFYTYSKQMMSLAVTYLKNTEDAEDAVSTVFEKIATKNFDIVRQIQNETDLRNYLLKSTKNTALNMMGKKCNQYVSLDEVYESEIADIDDISDEDFVEHVCIKMECEDIINTICSLEEKYKNVLYYHFVLEKSIPETAKLLFQSVSATKQQLVRGKKLLLMKLDRKGEQKNAYDESRV